LIDLWQWAAPSFIVTDDRGFSPTHHSGSWHAQHTLSQSQETRIYSPTQVFWLSADQCWIVMFHAYWDLYPREFYRTHL